MKFFIPLGLKCCGNYWNLGGVYGPYQDDEAVEAEIAHHWPNSKNDQFLVFDGQVVNVKPSPKERPESEKREPGNPENYEKNGDNWKCKDCGADILGATVAHPVWIHGSDGGDGDCEHETLPYCPNCEKEPNFHGAPVYAD